MKKIIENLIFLLAVFLFLYTSFRLGTRFQETAEQEEVMDSVLEIAYQTTNMDLNDTKSTFFTELEEESIRDIFDETRIIRNRNLYALYEENNDLMGWVQIEGTIIDYPIMQTFIEPDFYLNHGFDKNKSSFGAIYMDSRCVFGYMKNYVLYGHHMKNGSMFASLQNYTSYDYYMEHPIIQFDSMATLNDYQIIGAFSIPSSDIEKLQKFLLLDSQEHFDTFKEYFESNKFYETNQDYDFDDQFLTLMTCEYSHKNGRLFVIAKRIKTTEAQHD